MIKCLAIDDEPLALKQLATYISKIPYLELVGECQSAHDAKILHLSSNRLFQQFPIVVTFQYAHLMNSNLIEFDKSF